MATNKYRVREFTPNQNQGNMSHSFHAEAVVDNVITNNELAKKIEARGMSRAAEIKGILEEAANIILEEIKENNRVQLESGDGVLVSIYPTCSGSVSDKDVRSNPDKYPGKTAAEESMLTADMISWRIGASVGHNISKQFALQKSAVKVPYNPNQQTADPDADDTGNTGGNGGSTDGENEG
jgi:hypothetical protein